MFVENSLKIEFPSKSNNCQKISQNQMFIKNFTQNKIEVKIKFLSKSHFCEKISKIVFRISFCRKFHSKSNSCQNQFFCLKIIHEYRLHVENSHKIIFIENSLQIECLLENSFTIK